MQMRNNHSSLSLLNITNGKRIYKQGEIMKFTTKLYVSIGSIILLISISVVILLNMLEQSMINMHVVVNNLYERTDIASSIKYETANLGRLFREIMDEPQNARRYHFYECLGRIEFKDKARTLSHLRKRIHKIKHRN